MSGSGPSELGIVMRPGAMIRRPQKLSEGPAARADTQAISTKIFLRGLNVVAQCGVYSHEKGHTRPLVVDVMVWLDPTWRSHDDSLAQTVDYDVLAQHVRDVAGGDHLDLIETFAEHVCTRILADPRIERVRLSVEKPGAVPDALCSGVEMERSR